MRRAADLEDKSEKHIVTPARLLPARELLGDMLLELKRPADALKEYEASQVREPNRYRGHHGAGLAAAQAGNTPRRKSTSAGWSKWPDPAVLGPRSATHEHTLLATEGVAACDAC